MEKIRAYYQTAGRESVDFIVIHWINGSLDSCIRTFTEGVRQASAHYGVEDHRVVSFVDDGNTAWALGNWDANQRSISVEHSAQPGRPATDETYATSIRLITGLMGKHGLEPSTETIRPHHDFSATQCPGTMDLQRIIDGVKTSMQRIQTMGETMAKLDDDDLRNIYNAVWFGVPGAQLIPNEKNGNGEWPYTALGSLTARVGRDIVGSLGTASVEGVSAQIIEQLGEDFAGELATEIGKRLIK